MNSTFNKVMNRPPGMPVKQRGAVLLGLLLVAVLGSSLFFLNIRNNGNSASFDADTVQALNSARERLIAYAVFSHDLLGTGFGRFACQDGNNDGLPAGNSGNASTCEDRTGRLPVSETLPDGSVYFFSNQGRDVDQQFWYRVSAGWVAGAGPVNSSTPGELGLDGVGGYAAIVLAPGQALPFQDRTLDSADFYPTEHLEAANQVDQGTNTDFVSAAPANPGGFNDLVTGIRADELMSLITPRIAETVFTHLEAHWNTTLAGSYPANQQAFEDCLSTDCIDQAVPAWYSADEWNLVAQWQPIDTGSGILGFSGCSITFTLHHGSGIVRNGNRC